MDKKPIDVCPINGLCISLPQNPFAAEISGCSDTYRFIDLQIVQRSSPWLEASTILGIQELLCKMDTIAALAPGIESMSCPLCTDSLSPVAALHVPRDVTSAPPSVIPVFASIAEPFSRMMEASRL
jgi:hypothetical protein